MKYIALHSNEKERIWFRRLTAPRRLPEQKTARWPATMLSYRLEGVLNDRFLPKGDRFAIERYLWKTVLLAAGCCISREGKRDWRICNAWTIPIRAGWRHREIVSANSSSVFHHAGVPMPRHLSSQLPGLEDEQGYVGRVPPLMSHKSEEKLTLQSHACPSATS